jgi:hypothetical protein
LDQCIARCDPRSFSASLALSKMTENEMELQHLRYFVAVAEELNLRRAAERMFVAQRAVSAQDPGSSVEESDRP